MSYFLKKTNRTSGVYLQIYESYYDSSTKSSRHRAIKTLGYVSALIESGIDDPISYYSNVIDNMNAEHKEQLEKSKAQLVSDDPPIKNIGYFLITSILNKLNIKHDIKLFNLVRDFQFDVYDMLEALICSRIINPVSKLKSWQEVIPELYKKYNFTLDQIYDACTFLGEEYERIIEMFNRKISKVYGRKTDKVYFDCTNYYFEIDYEFEDKQKGPSKEHHMGPIISMALMLDENQIPIGMNMFPGNECEKPHLRNMIKDLRERNNIIGKTIQVADKGLNCGQNIYEAVLNGDGYIFSKSVKMLSQVEKTWVFLNDNKWKKVIDSDNNLLYQYKTCVDDFEYEFVDEKGKKRKAKFKEKRVLTYNPSLAKKKIYEIEKLADKAANLTKAKAKKNEYGEASKYVTFLSLDKNTGEISNGDDVVCVMNTEKIEEDKKFAGYNLLVTSETNMKAVDIYTTYHNLWKIEESFRVLKGQLEARPVYLHKKENIYGHFLICYLGVVILRLLQYLEFSNDFSCNQIVDFIRSYKYVVDGDNFTNLIPMYKVKNFEDKLNLNLDYLYPSQKTLKNILEFSWR